MPTPDFPTLDEVLTLARRLRPADQIRLVAQLAPDLGAGVAPRAADRLPVDDPRSILAQLREHFRAQGPVAPSMADDLAAARR